MKNGLKSIVALVAMMGLVGCGGNEGADFKAGFILVGDENEGYSEAHINGINAAAEKLGLSSSQIIMKKKVEENDSAKTAAEDLVSSGCSLVVSNSYGHQSYMADAAKEHEDV